MSWPEWRHRSAVAISIACEVVMFCEASLSTECALVKELQGE
jgi:hypothetical protein